MKNCKVILIIAVTMILISCSKEKKDWNNACNENSISAYKNFISKYPKSQFVNSADSSIEKLYWRKAKHSIGFMDSFLIKYPNSQYEDSVKIVIEELNRILALGDKFYNKGEYAKAVECYERVGVKEKIRVSCMKAAEDCLKQKNTKALLTMKIPNARITSIAISSDNKYIVSGSYVGTGNSSQKKGDVTLFELKTGKKIRTFKGHTGSVHSVAITSDNKYIVSASDIASVNADNTVRIWDLQTGEQIKEYSIGSQVMVLSSDDKYIVTGWLGKISILEFETGKEIKTLKHHLGAITSLAISPDNKYMVSGGSGHKELYDGFRILGKDLEDKELLLKVWDFHKGILIRNFKGHLSKYYTNVVDPETQRVKSILRLIRMDVYTVAVSPDNQYIVSGGRDEMVRLWSIETGKRIWSYGGHEDAIYALTISNDNKYVISGDANDGIIKILDLKTGKEIRTLRLPYDSIVALACTSDNKYLVSGSNDRNDNSIKVWPLDYYTQLAIEYYLKAGLSQEEAKNKINEIPI